MGFFSLCINLLMLTLPLYMLQIYDRVLISRSADTLFLLTLVAICALIAFGVLEAVRARVLVRVGAWFDHALADGVFPLVMESGRAHLLRDMESVRQFLTGRSILALFDLPWTPIFLALVYFLHPWLGHVALVGAVSLISVMLFSEKSTCQPLKSASSASLAASQFVEASCRNRDTVRALGMLPGLGQIWRAWHDKAVTEQSLAGDRASVATGFAKFVRVTIQVSILGVGAYLAIREITSPGVMIAASIITGKALAPVEAAIAGWRSLVQAREAGGRLREGLSAFQAQTEPMQLPAPKGLVNFEDVHWTPAGAKRPVLSAISFKIAPGSSVGIAGPSAAGKSSLARLIVGICQPTVGEVRLDGAELKQWAPADLGQHIGYLAQEVELFPGTVAQNIARFAEIDAEAVVDAAQLAGAHEMIVQLADGYDTRIGVGGVNLSGGQKQRIGLARAFYRRPTLIVLDEPTSNLDAIGEIAVRSAVDELKAGGSTIVVIAHRPSLVCGVDTLMVVQKGELTHFGPTAEVMPKVTRRPPSAASFPGP